VGSAARGVLNHISFVLGPKKIGVAVVVLPSMVGNDPTKVLAGAQEPIFSPGPECERVGQVPSVVFVEGLVRDGGRWLFYYGGADKNVGVATAPAR
jgi:predicted GH43/DUF377 family glycosyl hydrolase